MERVGEVVANTWDKDIFQQPSSFLSKPPSVALVTAARCYVDKTSLMYWAEKGGFAKEDLSPLHCPEWLVPPWSHLATVVCGYWEVQSIYIRLCLSLKSKR